MTSRRHDTLERASNHSAFGFCLMNYCWKQRICREYGARCGFAAIFTELSHIDTKHPKLSSKTSEKQNGLDGHCVFSPSTFVTLFVTGLLLELLFFRFVLRLDARWGKDHESQHISVHPKASFIIHSNLYIHHFYVTYKKVSLRLHGYIMSRKGWVTFFDGLLMSTFLSTGLFFFFFRLELLLLELLCDDLVKVKQR